MHLYSSCYTYWHCKLYNKLCGNSRKLDSITFIWSMMYLKIDFILFECVNPLTAIFLSDDDLYKPFRSRSGMEKFWPGLNRGLRAFASAWIGLAFEHIQGWLLLGEITRSWREWIISTMRSKKTGFHVKDIAHAYLRSGVTHMTASPLASIK